jgi:hypothetical protein
MRQLRTEIKDGFARVEAAIQERRSIQERR